jgi:hypothetical protein
MGEELRARAEGVWSVIVHEVFVTWEGRQDKAEKFIPPSSGEVSRFDRYLNATELDYVTGSRAASPTLAENYVGPPME